MEFYILGLLEAVRTNERLDLGGIRQQTVLATLLLDPNRVVTTRRLMEAIYGDDPPSTSRAQVQICISALRKLFAGHGDSDIISTHPQGYSIRVPEEQIDAKRFESLLLAAQLARRTENLAEAVRLYRQALSLWRGPALDGIDSRLVQSAAGRLAEHRITANEDCVQLELDLGRHHEVIAELTELIEAYPLRERLRGQLMTALYRSGRQAEALQVYRQTRQALIEELGIEPNERLQQLEHAILTSDESLGAPVQHTVEVTAAVPKVPGMLPTDIADFTGRSDQIRDLRRHLLRGPEGRTGFAVPIAVIGGKAGIGKTTIAIHVSHSVAAHFPDGQLFADLHADAYRPVSPMQVLERFLRVLGVHGAALPDSLEERAEMYRAQLSGRTMLIVLDNAASESQILPLLPGNPDAAVIITSRSRLAGLAGALHVSVDSFDSEQSVALLSSIAGTERMQSEPDATAALAELCGRLPLALRIAGARLSARPHWSIEQLVERLEDETRRLDELKHGDMAIRASISLTYDSVGEDARRLFRRLAILDCQVFSAWVGAPLLDQTFTDAQDLLDDLADAQLLETTGIGRGVHTQYRFHDLIQVFARERLAAEESVDERNAALSRVLGSLLFLAQSASQREYGADALIHSEISSSALPARLVDQLISAPLAWFERERPLVVSGIRQAAQAGYVDLCWGLAISAVTFFESRVYLDDWRETHQIALVAAQQGDDRRGQAAMLYSMGSLAITEQRFNDARCSFESAVELFSEIGDAQGMAVAIRSIGFLDRLGGDFEEAAANYNQALEIFRDAGNEVAAGYVLHNLAQLRLECDEPAEAKRLLTEALDLSKEGGGRRVEAQVLHRMGHAHLSLNEPDLAAEVFEQALEIVRAIGDSTGEAHTLHGLGIARLRNGDLTGAGTALDLALTLAASSSQRLVEAWVLSGLGEMALLDGDPELAVAHLQQAMTVFHGLHTPLNEARALITLGDAHFAAGDAGAAGEALTRALALTDKIGPPMGDRIRIQVAARLGEEEIAP